jgi:predicted dienelactone hydrolase
MYVLYPTVSNNACPEYAFPYRDTVDNVFPHMQRPGTPPLISDVKARYPVIVFSHGYEGHGLWDLHHLKCLASHGYIVVCPFYGDGRATGEDNFHLRPLLLRRTLDYILAHPEFGPAIDPARIGVSGSSFGGYTVLSTLGADRLDCIPGQVDLRIRAGLVLVPAMRHDQISLFFGSGHAGLNRINIPVFALYAKKDTVVLAGDIEAGLEQLRGDGMAVLLEDEGHILSEGAWPVALTWEVLFFNAWLLDDETARMQLHEGETVAGAVLNRKVFQKSMWAAPENPVK